VDSERGDSLLNEGTLFVRSSLRHIAANTWELSSPPSAPAAAAQSLKARLFNSLPSTCTANVQGGLFAPQALTPGILPSTHSFKSRRFEVRVFGFGNGCRSMATERRTGSPVVPNVRGKRATTAGRQARAMQDKPQQRAGLVACRRRSA
jgi:hypothetical protein